MNSWHFCHTPCDKRPTKDFWTHSQLAQCFLFPFSFCVQERSTKAITIWINVCALFVEQLRFNNEKMAIQLENVPHLAIIAAIHSIHSLCVCHPTPIVRFIRFFSFIFIEIFHFSRKSSCMHIHYPLSISHIGATSHIELLGVFFFYIYII